MGTVRPSALKKIWFRPVSMTAPSDLKTLLAMRKGVLDGTITTLIHLSPTGKKTDRLPITELSFPKRKLMAHGASFMDCSTLFGNVWQRSVNWLCPITDMLAPRSTIPYVPCETKLILSSDNCTLTVASSWFLLRGSQVETDFSLSCRLLHMYGRRARNAGLHLDNTLFNSWTWYVLWSCCGPFT